MEYVSNCKHQPFQRMDMVSIAEGSDVAIGSPFTALSSLPCVTLQLTHLLMEEFQGDVQKWLLSDLSLHMPKICLKSRLNLMWPQRNKPTYYWTIIELQNVVNSSSSHPVNESLNGKVLYFLPAMFVWYWIKGFSMFYSLLLQIITLFSVVQSQWILLGFVYYLPATMLF